jgi:phage shock protein E
MQNKGLKLALLFSIVTMTWACNSQTQKPSTTTTTTSKEMKTNKEIIVDVRTPEEWQNDGHAECSVNYPLDKLQDKINDLKLYDHVVLVCRSGGRAGSAKRMLEEAGIKNVENLGAWQNVSCAN